MGVVFEPIEAEFGWSRSETSLAASVSLLLYGLTAPFAAALMQRFPVRVVVASALCLVAFGSLGTTWMTAPWHMVLLWGGFVGVGTGSIALVFGAIIANRWFVHRRGLVTGVFSAASATGQLAFLPLIAVLAENYGWRAASILVAAVAVAIVPLALAFFADTPADAGVRPYGADESYVAPEIHRLSLKQVATNTVQMLFAAMRTRPWWILAFTFFVCGWSTNGLMQTHFISAAHDHGMPTTTAAGLLAIIGIFDIVGTVASGWLTDRFDSRILLVVYYGLRGLSLLYVPAVLGPHVEPPMLFFMIFYGLDWVATVPPTVALCRKHFGLEKSGVVYGWVFAAHMVGAGAGASFAGAIRELHGAYTIAWVSAGVLCLIAALSFVAMPSTSAVSDNA